MVNHIWSLKFPPSQDSEFTLWGRVLIDFCLELANISATLCCKQFPYWTPQKIHSLVVWEIMHWLSTTVRVGCCQSGMFLEDSETASLWWSQAAFLDVDCDGNTSQFWSTSSTGLGYTHHVSMSSCHIWSSFSTSIMGARDILIHSNMCVWAYVSRDVKGQLVSLLFTFQGRSPKYWSPVIVNLTANRWATFQKGTRISCPK